MFDGCDRLPGMTGEVDVLCGHAAVDSTARPDANVLGRDVAFYRAIDQHASRRVDLAIEAHAFADDQRACLPVLVLCH